MSEYSGAASALNDLIREANTSTEKKLTAMTSVRGTVTLVGDEKVSVDVGGGHVIPCTPTVKCHVGDRVVVETLENTATVTHNLSAQAATDEEVVEALNRAEQAAEAADDAVSSAHEASEAASAAQTAASAASTAAGQAQAQAQAAEADAQAASRSASEAMQQAGNAYSSAQSALASAVSASRSADDALVQLSVVQDVAGTLEWISDHGTFSHTEDQSVQEGKVYFTYNSETQDYEPVVEPRDDDIASYFELSLTDSQTDYIMSHLAVTSRGLWVLPGGKGSSTTPASGESQDDSDARQATGYKMLLASDGQYLYDGNGALVVKYGASIELGAGRPFSIGSQDAYILYYDSDHDGVADSMRIGGGVQIGSIKTLDEALDDIAEANQKADDVPIVTLSSTNGTVFKRNVGISTTIVATIYTPGGKIDNAQELARRFGSGAYLEWGWRDVVTEAEHVIVSTDPRIGAGGFTFTVSPEDIDTQAVITCSLNY